MRVKCASSNEDLERNFKRHMRGRTEQTFHKQMRGTGGAACVIGHEARVVSAL